MSCSGLGRNTTAKKDYINCLSGEEKSLAITPTAGVLLKHTAAIDLLFSLVIYMWNSTVCMCECFGNTRPICQYAGSTYKTP